MEIKTEFRVLLFFSSNPETSFKVIGECDGAWLKAKRPHFSQPWRPNIISDRFEKHSSPWRMSLRKTTGLAHRVREANYRAKWEEERAFSQYWKKRSRPSSQFILRFKCDSQFYANFECFQFARSYVKSVSFISCKKVVEILFRLIRHTHKAKQASFLEIKVAAEAEVKKVGQMKWKLCVKRFFCLPKVSIKCLWDHVRKNLTK